MTRSRWGAVAVLTAAIVMIAAPSAHAGRQAVERYVTTGNEPVVVGTAWFVAGSATVACSANGRDVGGACFDVSPGERTMQVVISDETGRLVSGAVTFDSPARSTQRFCNSGTIRLPRDVTRAVVVVDSTIVGCGVEAGGPATAGVVVATFE